MLNQKALIKDDTTSVRCCMAQVNHTFSNLVVVVQLLQHLQYYFDVLLNKQQMLKSVCFVMNAL